MYDDPHDPFLPVNWRWLRAQRILEHPFSRSPSPIDGHTRVAVRYLREHKKCAGEHDIQRLAFRFPWLYQAWAVYQRKDNDLRWTIEARLLANDSTPNIAKLNCVSEALVDWYEMLFFDVRERLQCTDWILRMVFGDAARRGISHGEHGLLLKLLGYLGGPDVVTAMTMGGTAGLAPQVAKNVELFFAQHFRSTLTYQAAIASRTIQPTFDNQPYIIDAYQRMEADQRSQGASSTQGDQIADILNETMKLLPFWVGKRPKGQESDPMTKYDNCAAELRSHEMIAVACGMETEEMRQVANMQ